MKLQIEIPVTSVVLKSEKSVVNNSKIDYSFEGSKGYSKENLLGIENEFRDIQKIEFQNGAVLEIQNISEEDEIYSLKLEWGYKTQGEESYLIHESIDLLSFEHNTINSSMEIIMDDALKQLAIKMDEHPYYSFIFKITGNSNFNLNGKAELEVPVIVESKAYDTQFTVF